MRTARFFRPGAASWLAMAIMAAGSAWNSAAHAGPWPQILGPARNGKAEGERIASRWPKEGPPVAWRHPAGRGYAGAAAVGGVAILFHRQGDEAIGQAVDALSGKPRWKVAFPTRYVSSIDPDDGPRAVPLIHGARVFFFSADGVLVCVSLADGKTLWTRTLAADYKAPEGYFGAGSSPIVEEDRLLLNVGGRGAGLVALDVKDGHTLWQATDEPASYSSPVATTLGGRRHVIFVTRLNVVSVDPASGQEWFRFPFGQRGPTVNAANPLAIGSRLFVTASYGIGAKMASLESGTPREEWADDATLSSQFSTPIEHEGYLYGVHGRQDGPPADLRCVELASGKVMWRQAEFGTASLIFADGKLLATTADGELILIEPSSSAYRELDRAKILASPALALPALADGLLYVRDRREFKSLDLRGPP